MEQPKPWNVVQLPFPVFGAVWERGDVLAYGGGGSKYGIPNGIYFFSKENRTDQLTKRIIDHRVKIDGETYTVVCIFSSNETITDCLCVSKAQQADEETSKRRLISVTQSCLNVVSFVPGDSCPFVVQKHVATSKVVFGRSSFTTIVNTLQLSGGSTRRLLIATWRVSKALYLGAFTWQETGEKIHDVVENTDSVKVSCAISQCLIDSVIDFDLLIGEVNDIAAQAVSDVSETMLCAAVVEWKGHRRVSVDTCLFVVELNKSLALVPFGCAFFDPQSKGRFTKCIWMNDGRKPAIGVLQVTRKMTTLRKFSLNLQERTILSDPDVFLTYEKITTCTSFPMAGRQYFLAGTASGEILLFSLNPLHLERRKKTCDSPITSITLGPQVPPVICTTSLSGSVSFQSVMEIPKVISWYDLSIWLVFYGALILLSLTNMRWGSLSISSF